MGNQLGWKKSNNTNEGWTMKKKEVEGNDAFNKNRVGFKGKEKAK